MPARSAPPGATFEGAAAISRTAARALPSHADASAATAGEQIVASSVNSQAKATKAQIRAPEIRSAMRQMYAAVPVRATEIAVIGGRVERLHASRSLVSLRRAKAVTSLNGKRTEGRGQDGRTRLSRRPDAYRHAEHARRAVCPFVDLCLRAFFRRRHGDRRQPTGAQYPVLRTSRPTRGDPGRRTHSAAAARRRHQGA